MLHFYTIEKNQLIVNEISLKELFRHSRDGVIFFNQEGIITDCNSSFQLLSGFSKNEILQSTLSELLNFSINETENILHKISSGDKAEIEEHPYSFKNQKGKYNGCIFPIFEKENFTGGFLVFSKLTQDYYLERKILEKDSLIDEVEKLAQIGRWEVNIQTNIAHWSDEMYRIFEIDTPSKVYHQDFLQFLHPEDLPATQKVIQQVRQKPREMDFEYRIITPKGKVKYISGRVKSLQDNDGKILNLIGYCQDISDRKKSENMISGIVNSSMEGIMVLNAERNVKGEIDDFRISFVNTFAEHYLGKSFAYLKDRMLCEEHPGIKTEGIFDLLKASIETGKPMKKEIFYNHEGFSNWVRLLTAKLEDSCVVTFQDYTELMNMIQQMKKTQTFLFLSQESGNVGSFEMDYEKGIVLQHSPQFLKIMELNDAVNLSYDTFKAKIFMPHQDKVDHCMKEALKCEHVCETEFIIMGSEGNEKTCFIKSLGVIPEDGGRPRLICSILDMTKAKEKDLALQKAHEELLEYSEKLKALNESLEEKVHERTQELSYSDERFKLIAKATNNAMYDWNFETNELWYNDVFSNEFGFSEKGFEKGYENWKNHLHPEERQHVVRGLEDAIATGKTSWKDEYHFLNALGNYVFIIDRGFIIHDKDHNPVRMVGAMIQISDVTRIEEKLRQSEENYRFLAESMPQLVWITNEKGESIYSNRKWTEYTGQDFDEYRNMGWANAIHMEEYPLITKIWNQCVTTGNEYKVEYRLKNKDGEYRWFLARAIPMKNPEGKIIRWVGTSTDIHEEKMLLESIEEGRKQLNELNIQLNKRNDQLARINKELDNFVYAASHDLRSPVRNIESLIELFTMELKAKSNQTIDYYLELLLKSITNLKTTIHDLTEVAKIEEGSDKEYIEIQEIINDVLFSLKDQIEQSHADIRLNLQAQEICFSRKNLRSIFYNLLSNSIKYKSRDRNPYIEISCRSLSTTSLEITVKDNGMGMRQEDLYKVFTPFKRIHHQVEGSGMGMPLVKRIIDNNNGTIEIESELNKGTLVRIILKQ